MISDIQPVNNYAGNGSSTTFDFDFYIENASELNVYHISQDGTFTLLTKDLDYSINEFTTDNSRVTPDFSEGGYIVFPLQSSSYSVLSANEKISLQLTLPFVQESDYNNSSLLNLGNLEFSLDYLTRLCQILKRNLDRCAKIKEGSTLSVDELVENINTLADDKNNIDSIASDLTNIDSVAGDLTNIDSVAGDLTNIDSVASSISDVNSVASSISDVNSVASSISDINSVADDLTNIDSVAGDLTNIDSVADDLTNIDSVAGDLENINNASQYADLSHDWAVKMDGKINNEDYSAKYYAQQAAQGQLQSDWNQTDNTAKDYIKNKPTIPTAGANTDLSNLTATGEAHFQEPLVSGTNIKTINNTALLGSGNIDTLEVFVAEYGVTSYADVQTAYNSGKIIFCQYTVSNTLLYIPLGGKNLNVSSGDVEYSFESNLNANGDYYCLYLNSFGWFSPISYEVVKTTSTKVSSSRFDGQWTVSTSYKYIANAVTINSNATYTSDISSALPNDTNKYIVVISGWGYTATTSGNTANIYVTTDLSSSFSDTWMLAKAKTQAGNAQHWGGSATVVVGTGRTIYIKNTGTGKTSDVTVWISAYRRVGTNS